MDRIIEKKKWTLKKIFMIAGIAAFAVLAIYILFFRDKSSRLFVEKQRITIASAEEGQFQEFIPVDGVVQPKISIYLDAVFGGRVEEIFVRDGALVQKGEKILRLSNSTLEMDYMNRENHLYDVLNNLQNTKLNIEQNKFNLEQQIADLDYQLDKARTDFQRKENLFREKMISREDFENATRDFQHLLKKRDIAARTLSHDSLFTIAQMSQIRESIARMQNNLKMLKSNLENLIVRAPIAGQLSAFHSEIGETKNAGENLAQIDVPKGFKLRARIDERYVSRSLIGQEAEFDFSGQTYHLQIGKIYSSVQGGAFEVDLFFIDNKAPESLRRGQTIQLRLKFSGVADAITIPRGGFYQETGGNWIYVVHPSGEYATKRKIRIGRQNIHHYEVLEGLEPGEKVVVSSYDAFGSKDKLIFK